MSSFPRVMVVNILLSSLRRPNIGSRPSVLRSDPSIREGWGAPEGNAALRNSALSEITEWSPTAIRAMLGKSALVGSTAGEYRPDTLLARRRPP